MSHVRIFLEGEGEGFEGIWDSFLTPSNHLFFNSLNLGEVEGRGEGRGSTYFKLSILP